MSFSQIIEKLSNNQALNSAELLETRSVDDVVNLVKSWVVGGSQIPYIRNLRADNIFISSGEVRLGESTPGENFSGVIIAFPAFTYNGEEWNIAGIDDDVLQVGIRASDGRLVAGGGGVELSEGGIAIIDNGEAGNGFLSFYSEDLVNKVHFKFDANNMHFQNFTAGCRFQFSVKTTDGGVPSFVIREDPANDDRAQYDFSDGTNGAKLTMGNNISLNAASDDDLFYSTHLQIRETAITPTLTYGGNIYFRNNKLVIQWNDSPDVRYKYLDLTGAGVTWVSTTTPP